MEFAAARSVPSQALQTEATGNPTHITLDRSGRPIAKTLADGATTTWVRDPLTGYVTSQMDFLSRTT